MRLATVQGTLHGSDHPGEGDSNSAADDVGPIAWMRIILQDSARFYTILQNYQVSARSCKIILSGFVTIAFLFVLFPFNDVVNASNSNISTLISKELSFFI